MFLLLTRFARVYGSFLVAGFFLPFPLKCGYLLEGKLGLFCGLFDRSGLCTLQIFVAVVTVFHFPPRVVDVREAVPQGFS